MVAAVYRVKGSSHTAILVTETKTVVQFITMEDVANVRKMEPRGFHLEWEEMTNYPVRRCAELYLGTAAYREMSSQVRDRLERIMADPATEFDPESINVNPKETAMATATAPKKTAPTKPTSAPAKTAPAKTAAKAPPAAPQKPVAKSVPAKTAPAKTAPNGISTVVAQAGKGKSVAAPKTAAVVARPVNDEKLKVADPAKVNRGETAEYVEVAKGLKTFTRQQLHDAMVAKGKDSKKARIKIADCVYFKVFTAAKA